VPAAEAEVHAIARVTRPRRDRGAAFPRPPRQRLAVALDLPRPAAALEHEPAGHRGLGREPRRRRRSTRGLARRRAGPARTHHDRDDEAPLRFHGTEGYESNPDPRDGGLIATVRVCWLMIAAMGCGGHPPTPVVSNHAPSWRQHCAPLLER